MIEKDYFGKLSNGESIDLYTLKNNFGEVQITNYGARVVSWTIKKINVVLGYNDAASYELDDKYLGAIAGRCANRIADAKFELNGKIYQLDKNDGGKNHLHGGFNGFEKKIWRVEIVNDSLKMTCESPDGEGGYPGNLTAIVTYSLSEENELKIKYKVMSDQDTICNLTNHTYFNLNGGGSILNQKIQINADNYTWANAESILDGRILSVENTPLDLRKLTTIGDHIDDDFDQLNYGHGYDHNFCINNFDGTIRKAAEALGEESGIKLEVFTTQPGLQFYTGNFLNGDFARRSGFALEAQIYPNAINLKNFPQPILRRGEKWTAETIYKLM